jgi:cytochrome c oxidase assembly factor CtaG
VLAVFVAALQSSALGAFMTLAGHPWYPAYAHPGGGGLSAMEDQQVAGVIMWGLAGLAYVVAGVAVFATWVGRAERLRPGRGPVQETVAEGVT